MSSPEPGQPDEQRAVDEATEQAADDSAVSPPSYPAYGTPPPEGLPSADG
ncbi:hypothetical protein [Mycobacterium sp. 1423905.2]|nr:hypothetical protein [Mycobacterium sp. 1423905.2]